MQTTPPTASSFRRMTTTPVVRGRRPLFTQAMRNGRAMASRGVVCQQPPVVRSTQFRDCRRSRPGGRRDYRNRGRRRVRSGPCKHLAASRKPWPLYLGERPGRVAPTCGLPLRRAHAAVSAGAATALLLVRTQHSEPPRSGCCWLAEAVQQQRRMSPPMPTKQNLLLTKSVLNTRRTRCDFCVACPSEARRVP
jgi:hypothetical protein